MSDGRSVRENSMPRRPTKGKPSPETRQFGPKTTGPKRFGDDRPVRLQRLLASAGFGSRRLCEELIQAGRVEVDGAIVDQLGTTVDPATSKVFVDGVALRPQKLVYYAVHKPVGVVTTNSDPEGRPRVVDLVPPTERVFPVGRLDRSSEGLILLTNDGELAQKLAHPKFQIRKVYRVTVAGKVEAETMRTMRKGIYIAEGFVHVEGAKLIKARTRATELEITLSEGKNREIRRIFARLGHKVLQLRRIAIGPLRLGDTPTGAYRPLTNDEVKRLQNAVRNSGQSSATVEQPPRTGKAAPMQASEKSARKPKARKPNLPNSTARKSKSAKSTGRQSTGRKPAPAQTKFRPGGAASTTRFVRPPATANKPRPSSKGQIQIRHAPGVELPPLGGSVIGAEQTEADSTRKSGNKRGSSTGSRSSGRPKSTRSKTIRSKSNRLNDGGAKKSFRKKRRR